MNNLTKMQIEKSANEVFEAFVDPVKIGNFWFSSSSERWERGKTITLRYEEYHAQVNIFIDDLELNKKIVFTGGDGHMVTITLTAVNPARTIIEVFETGFEETAPDFIHQIIDNKEGWVYTLTCLKAYLEYGVNTLRGALVK
ncbi:SRPBCC domain-containing protein [Caldibacillus lycopersici]|uniref:SRPBCC domain-containing protein n=1 Tax=Perspicuibacillus lycopersici TaxID=1325689 RepID=A0AAE3IUC9_9BACI|nr:SRPBCC domain-containing protein [Perspicuibacillus lycopersici]MCU9614795.1 SRPBCC domain-containing protein [Perspicuibacillus lycopersici]